jgi:hypothetical protein
MFKNKMYILISSFIDNELNEKDKIYVENKIKTDPEWEKIYNTFQKNKKAVIDLKGLPENDYMNQRILKKVKNPELNDVAFLPIQKKYIPAAVALVVLAVIFVALFMFQQKNGIELFLKENTSKVKSLYENTFANNDLYPINASLSNDDVFKFAVYGVLPAQNQKGKYIQLGNNESSGYYVEVADKHKLNKPNEQVPLEQVYKELKVDESQQKRIDKVLKSFQKNIEASFLAAPKQYLAVDADIWNFQNAVVYEISKNLSAKQRKEFFALTGIPYVKYANINYDDSRKDSIVKNYASLSQLPRDFLIIKPDTLFVRKMNVNYDSIRLKIKKLKDNQFNIGVELDHLLSGRPKNRTITVSVQKDVKTSEGVTVSVKHNIVKGTGISISVDTSVFRITIPDMDNIIPELMDFDSKNKGKELKLMDFDSKNKGKELKLMDFDLIKKGKELKMMEKIYQMKKNQYLQKNMEKELREAERNFKNKNYNQEEFNMLLNKADSIYTFHRFDSTRYLDSKNKANQKTLKKMKNMNQFQNLFNGKNNMINSIMNNFLDKKNSRLFDSMMKQINVDSIINDAFDKVKINIQTR